MRSRSQYGPGRDRASSCRPPTACRPPAPSAAACCAASSAPDSDTETEAIRRRLDLNAGEVRGLRGQVRELRVRTDYAAVERDAAPGRRRRRIGRRVGGDGLGGALDDALGSL